jgi:hypothetical protein
MRRFKITILLLNMILNKNLKKLFIMKRLDFANKKHTKKLMKLLLAITIVAFSFSGTLHAQIHPRAIGLRLGGDGSINGAEISYQQKLSSINRLELDAGFGASRKHNRMTFIAIYQWVWKIDGGFNWYAGPAAGVGLYSYIDEPGFINIGLGGQVGIEYDFNYLKKPFIISIDGRPMWDFLGGHAGFGWGASLGIRYTW